MYSNGMQLPTKPALRRVWEARGISGIIFLGNFGTKIVVWCGHWVVRGLPPHIIFSNVNPISCNLMHSEIMFMTFPKLANLECVSGKI